MKTPKYVLSVSWQRFAKKHLAYKSETLLLGPVISVGRPDVGLWNNQGLQRVMGVHRLFQTIQWIPRLPV
jgi:hypothetical protein